MIYTAISALKEKDGSSKGAIGKYIEQVYKDNLPSTHSALLTHHLKRLKDNGHLLMVKKSYKLPRSDDHEASAPAPASTSTPQPQRSRGRPPKPKSQLLVQPQLDLQPQPFPQAQAQPVPVQQNADVFAALGLGDEPAVEVKKKGPGRPRKSDVAAASNATGVGQVGPAGRRGRPPGSGRSGGLKRAGRPPKPKSLSAISNGLKKRPGRPPKNQSNPTVIPFAAPATATAVPPLSEFPPSAPVPAGTAPSTVPTATAPFASPKPRGRPRKSVAGVALTSATSPVVGAGRGRGRGRGRRRSPSASRRRRAARAWPG